MTDEQKDKLTKQFLALLHAFVCEVTFTKADSTERKMRCSLNFNVISGGESTYEHTVITTPLSSHTHTIRVFDIDAKDWRSFRLDSVKTFTTFR